MPEPEGAPAFTAQVTGSVQGVGFRAWTKFASLRLGLNGYARNLADGSVEVVASGDRDALNELLTLLRRGPSAGTVLSVDVEWSSAESPVPDLPRGFEVRR